MSRSSQSGNIYSFAHFLAERFGVPDVLYIPAGASLDHRVENAIVWVEEDAALENHLPQIHTLAQQAPALLLSVPDAERSGVGRWSLDSLQNSLVENGFYVDFIGYAVGASGKRDTLLAILDPTDTLAKQSAPDDFRVVIFLTVYNEADIITPTLTYLISQGVQVYVIDNWSDDGTYEQAQQHIGRGVIAVERFPQPQPEQHTFSLFHLMKHVEELAQQVEADWFMHYDCDEIREACWHDVSLHDAIYQVDQRGFTAIDHTVINFEPVDDTYQPQTDFAAHFRHYDFGRRPGLFRQIKGWKNLGVPVNLAAKGGHHVRFEGMRVFPYKFLLRHYPLRSKAQAVAKIRQRQQQSNPAERAHG
ncbi:MAG: glycosyltransferase family 2 protein, partial [Anaerolineae bacterium]|nr:glycosyltransferase family 2 protein [Anaerolineae bacterium]